MTMPQVLNAIARKLAHGHALAVVPEGMVSIWELQSAWRQTGKTRNLVYYALDMPYLRGLEGWRETVIPPKTEGETPLIQLRHITGTGRMRVESWERYVPKGTLDQHVLLELWSGNPHPRRMIQVHGEATVRLNPEGAHQAESVQFYLVSDETTEEDRGERLDRLSYLWWLHTEVGPIVWGADALLPLLEARAEELRRVREAEEAAEREGIV